MLHIKIVHTSPNSQLQDRQISFSAEVTELAPLQLGDLEDCSLDIVQIIETTSVITHYCLYNAKGQPLTSAEAFSRTPGRGNQLDKAFNVDWDPTQAAHRALGPPLTFDLEKHITYRNSITTDRCFYIANGQHTFVRSIRR